MALTKERRKRLEIREKRAEMLRKQGELLRPADCVEIYQGYKIGFYYDHWVEMGGKVEKQSRKALYHPIPKVKIDRYFGFEEKPAYDYFLNLSDQEKEKLVIELMPLIRRNLFN